MTFAIKSLIAAGVLATGLGLSSASAMPMAPLANTTPHVEKAAFVCIGNCYHRFGYRPYARPFRALRPLALYRGYPRYRY